MGKARYMDWSIALRADWFSLIQTRGGDVKILCSLIGSFLWCVSPLLAQVQVVPCQLSNPDQDTLRLFPGRTNYRTEFIRTDEIGSQRNLAPYALYRDLEQRLGDTWDPIWETEDIPYVFYEILYGSTRIGWVFGANQGWPGADNAQLMMGIDLNERIQEFYYQKLPSLEKSVLQNSQFYVQFIGLTLQQFYVHERLKALNVQDTDIQSIDMIQRIQDPTKSEHEGFQKTLRGIKKILIYLDDFKFNNAIKKEEVFQSVDYLVKNKDRIPLLTNGISEIKKTFKDFSRYVVDLVPVNEKENLLAERMGDTFGDQKNFPVYVIYKDVAYQSPFVRGTTIGYVLPIQIGAHTAVISIGAQENNKGKILAVEVDQTSFPQFNGLSLVHFYTKEYLVKSQLQDEELDKIGSITNLRVNGSGITAELKQSIKKALVLIDEQYFHNFFKKKDIMEKIKEYKQGQQK